MRRMGMRKKGMEENVILIVIISMIILLVLLLFSGQAFSWMGKMIRTLFGN